MRLAWPGPEAITDRAGACYTMAGQFVAGNYRAAGLQMFLVHGLLRPDRAAGLAGWSEHHPGVPVPPPNPHAWVELEAEDGTLCADPVLRLAWPLAEHRELFGAEVYRRYRADVALDVMTRNGSYGPWDRRSVAAHAERVRVALEDPRFSLGAGLARFTGTG